MDLYVKYPVLLTADAWHLRTKGQWQEDTSLAYRECYLAKARKFAAEDEQALEAESEVLNELQDEDWILPDELLPEALLVEELVAEEQIPEETEALDQRPGPINVD